MEYLATFFTHSGAIKYQRHMRGLKVNAELMPVPRKVSSNCGIAARFVFDGDIKTVISDDIEQVLTIKDREYILIYKAGEL